MELEVGRVTHFYNHLCVAVLTITGDLRVGDTIHILGHLTDFTQPLGSMEIEHHKVTAVKAGQQVAIRVAEPVREHDRVYKVAEAISEPHGT